MSNPPGFAARFAWEAIVEIGERRSMGESPAGARWIIPILGGRFSGPAIRGTVVPGGADRQLWRSDGVRELDARYELQTDDGALITVHNRVLIDDPEGPARYAASHIDLIAPAGPHEWINRRRFVGRLRSLMPAQAAVAIGFFELHPL